MAVDRRIPLKVENLRKAIKEALLTVDIVIGYRQGFDPLHAEPWFVSKPEEADQAIIGPICEQNLASYLPSRKGKTGVVVKGCDSRSVLQLLQEGLIKREDVVIIGVPCRGVVSVKKVMAAVDFLPIEFLSLDGTSVEVLTLRGKVQLALSDVSPDRCRGCQYPTPLIYDFLVDDPIESATSPEKVYEDIRAIEAKSLEERRAYWEKELSRCTRCYACRNACPLCVCRESCIAETREPHWITQRANLREKMMFHMIHALHLAGRCTECGECERACPMGIPLGKLKKKINMDMKELFDYVPGIRADDKPPLYTFLVDEEKIEEHKLS
jgi:formate dehydrogenase (coenzyme F420) beta subunit